MAFLLYRCSAHQFGFSHKRVRRQPTGKGVRSVQALFLTGEERQDDGLVEFEPSLADDLPNSQQVTRA